MATSGARATARDRPYYTRAWQANSWYSRGDPLRSPMRTNFRVERRLPAPPQDWGKPSTSSPRAWWADPSYSRVDPCGQPISIKLRKEEVKRSKGEPLEVIESKET